MSTTVSPSARTAPFASLTTRGPVFGGSALPEFGRCSGPSRMPAGRALPGFRVGLMSVRAVVALRTGGSREGHERESMEF
jgi:hypothetical protein